METIDWVLTEFGSVPLFHAIVLGFIIGFIVHQLRSRFCQRSKNTETAEKPDKGKKKKIMLPKEA